MVENAVPVKSKSDEPQPIAKPGTHEQFMKFFKKHSGDTNHKVLDLAAGHGAFSKRLYEMGYPVSACDLFPEIFYFKEIECKKVDMTQTFPYQDNTFDKVIAIEVSEHILNQEFFFNEIFRIIKPGGQLLLSTPNILSLKSRIRYLFKGFFYSFDPLDRKNYDGLQHVSSLTLDQYNYVAERSGFKEAVYDIDKKQNTSTWLLVLLFPFIWLANLKKGIDIHNRRKLLLGRKLFLAYRK